MVVIDGGGGSCGKYIGNCVFIVPKYGNDGVEFCCDGDG